LHDLKLDFVKGYSRAAKKKKGVAERFKKKARGKFLQRVTGAEGKPGIEGKEKWRKEAKNINEEA